MATTGGLLDLEKQFAFYGAYHSEPTNVLIHVLFVWPIFFSALLLLHYAPPFFSLPIPFNAAAVVAIVYAAFYIRLDRSAGLLAAVLCIFCWLGSGVLAPLLGTRLGLEVGLAAQIFCWTAQFIGHGLFEGRAPALLTNLFQALLMAPFFVLLEVMMRFGYEPYPGFESSVRAKIATEIEAWRARKQAKAALLN